MFTSAAIRSIRYYLDGPEANTMLGYYAGDADDEAGGVWWRSNPSTEKSRTIFPDCRSGAAIDVDVFVRLCEGTLADGRTVHRADGIRRPAYDLHFAAPKSVSLLSVFLNRQYRRAIRTAHDRAVRSALKFCFEHGFIETRSGRSGIHREAAKEYVAAIFRHNTSRANDPQLHSHCPLPNIALKRNGSIGATDNKKLLSFQRLVGAVYSAALAAGMRDIGFEVEADGRSFKVRGVPDELCALFSKRRKTIEDVGKARGFDPSRDRKKAQFANLDTRSAKTLEAPIEELRKGWLLEMGAAGFRLEDLPVPGSRFLAPSGNLEELIGEALSLAFINDSVLSEPKLLASVAEHLQWCCDAHQIDEIIGKLLPGLVTCLNPQERRSEHKMFSTPQIIEDERSILAHAHGGRSLRVFVPMHHIDAAIAARPTLSDEQKAAVRHALNNDQFSIVEGAAGAGKSFAAGAISAAATLAGLKVYVLGPSWSAANVLAKDTNTATGQTRALAGFVNDGESGKLQIGADAIILLDEGGLADRSLTARLMSLARVAGCKVVVSGDTKQLQPVGAGAPLRLLTRALGSSKINEVRRQSHAWARAASMRFGQGRSDEALKDYDFRGHVSWCAGAAEAMENLADRFIADRLFDQASAGEGKVPTSLIIASWNEDVQELNRQIRLRLKAAGEIEGVDTEIPVLVRTKRKRATADRISLAVGDRIIFGESLEVSGRTIRNADVAKVASVGTGANPTILFHLEPNGEEVSAVLSDLVGFREVGEPKIPLIRHAYCVTTNFSQGMTVDRAYVAALRPMSSEAIYVAMTRHRHSAQLFVDTSRFRSLEAGKRVAPPAVEYKASFFAECLRPTRKLNVTDLNPALTAAALTTTTSTLPRGVAKSKTRLQMEQRVLQGLGSSARLDEPVTISGMPNALYRHVTRVAPSGKPGFRTVATAWDSLTNWISYLKSRLLTLLPSLDQKPPAFTQLHRLRFTLKSSHSASSVTPTEVQEHGHPEQTAARSTLGKHNSAAATDLPPEYGR